MYFTEILLSTAMIRGRLDCERNTRCPAITAPRLQTIKQSLTTSKHSIEFTLSDFPFHFNGGIESQCCRALEVYSRDFIGYFTSRGINSPDSYHAIAPSVSIFVLRLFPSRRNSQHKNFDFFFSYLAWKETKQVLLSLAMVTLKS